MGSLTNMAKQGGATNVKTLQVLLEKKKNTIVETLQSEVKFNKFRSNLVRLYDSTNLKDCDPMSVLGAAMQIANLQLDIDPTLGQAYVLARWDKNTRSNVASFQIGYQGLLELARRSGEIKRIEAHTIWENEKYEYFFDDEKGTVIKHFPLPPSQRGEKRIAAFFVGYLTNGSIHKEFIWAEEIEIIKSESLSKIKPEYQKFSPWKASLISEEAMWKKTAIRRGLKYLPKTSEMETVIALEDEEIISSIEQAEIPETPEISNEEPLIITSSAVVKPAQEVKPTIKPAQEAKPNVKPTPAVVSKPAPKVNAVNNQNLFNGDFNPFSDEDPFIEYSENDEYKLF